MSFNTTLVERGPKMHHRHHLIIELLFFWKNDYYSTGEQHVNSPQSVSSLSDKKFEKDFCWQILQLLVLSILFQLTAFFVLFHFLTDSQSFFCGDFMTYLLAPSCFWSSFELLFRAGTPKVVISALLNKSAWNIFMRSALTRREADPGVWCFHAAAVSLPISLSLLTTLSASSCILCLSWFHVNPTHSPSLLFFPVFSSSVCWAESSYPRRALFIPSPCPL